MTTESCTCEKKGKKSCPVCNKKTDYLRDFHKINPEAAPGKTAAAARLPQQGRGLWGGLSEAAKQRIIGAGKSGLATAAIPALAGGAINALNADPGESTAGAFARGAATAGLPALALGGLHNLGMTGKSELAHSYQRGLGADVRNVGNWGREQLGLQRLRHPNTPPAPPTPPAEVPSVTPTKTSMYYDAGMAAALETFAL